jgi:uncharacterized membrane protein YeaQ/YmgE (transglycosylase-associated protein family)
MTWTIGNLIIQTIAGILGGHAAAAAAKEHSFGFLGHTSAGLLGGAASGLFLQTLASTVVTGSGSVTEPTAVENAVVQVLAGAVAGGCTTLVVGFVKHSIEHHRSQTK